MLIDGIMADGTGLFRAGKKHVRFFMGHANKTFLPPKKKMESPAQEKLPAKLKGVGDSLWVTFDPTQSKERLEAALKQIFERLRHLAVNARVILDSGEENGHEALIGNLGTYLKENFAVGMVSAPPPKRSQTSEAPRRKELGDSWRYRRSDVLMISGRVRSGQKLEAKKHLVLMGDVNPGGQVIAGGDVIVLGRLCGNAVAGHPENEMAIVMALDFRPTQIQIGGFVAAGLPAGSDKVAEFAHVEEGKIVVEDYLKADPFSKMPWPEVR